MCTSGHMQSLDRALASLILGTVCLLGTVQTVNCWEVSREEVMKQERLYQDKQYGRAAALGFPLYRKLVSEKITEKGVQDFGFLLAASLEAHKRAERGLAYAAYRSNLSLAQVRRQVEGYYEEAQKVGVGQPLKLSGLIAKLGVHRQPDLSALDQTSQEFLNIFRRCVLLDCDRKLAQICQDSAARMAHARVKLALANYVVAYALLMRDDDQAVQDLHLLPPGFTTPAQLAEFANFADRLRRPNAAIQLYSAAAHAEVHGNGVVAYLMKRAEILVKLKGIGDGIKAYRSIVKKYRQVPSAAGAQLQVVRLLAFEWKKYEDALAECKRLVELFANTTQAMEAEFMIGQLYYLARDYDNATAALETLVRKYAGQRWVVNAKLLLAFTYLDEGSTEKARAVFRNIVNNHTAEEAAAQAQLFLGYIGLIERDNPNALRELQELVQRSPKSVHASQAKRYIELLNRIVEEAK